MNEQCLGIDWGGKRIGLALGNSENKIASPFKTIQTIDDIKKIILQEGIERLVVGEPVNDQGNGLDRDFKDFLERLTKETKLPVSLIDERFTSQLADRLDKDARRHGEQDSLAAMLILQGYFDGLG